MRRRNGGRAQAPTPSALMNGWGRFPRVARRPSGSDRGQPWAEGWNPVGILKTKRRRRGIVGETGRTNFPSSVRSGICRPDGAGDFGGVAGSKDFGPDGATDNRNVVASFSAADQTVAETRHLPPAAGY